MPELLKIMRFVGGIEVQVEPHPHQDAATDGDIGIAGKVTVDLCGVAVHTGKHLERGIAAR